MKVFDFKCPKCGAYIKFDSSKQKMLCPYCDAEIDVEGIENFAQAYPKTKATEMEWENSNNNWSSGEEEALKHYSCNSCGGEIICDENTSASSCPYCGNPLAIIGRLSGTLKPDFIIPFKKSKEDAINALTNHVKSKPLLPKVFKNENHIEEIKGMYVPMWIFDSRAVADIDYRATAQSSYVSGDYMYTLTKHYMLYRKGSLDFEGIPVDGSKSIANDIMESIEPFDLSQAKEFNIGYLSGFYADKYDISDRDTEDIANARLKKSVEDAFLHTTQSFGSVYENRKNISLKNPKVKYALYPVWFLNTKYKDKFYSFAMNGQTGKFVGNLPIDKGKLAKWGVGVFGLGMAFSYFIIWIIETFAL